MGIGKKLSTIIPAIIFLVFPTVKLHAYEFEASGFYFNIISENPATVEVTYGNNPGIDYLGEKNLPSEVSFEGKNYTVTVIGTNAFIYCNYLESIRLPETIKEIKEFSFCNCSSLREINFPEGLEIIEMGAFETCMELTSLKFPSSLKEIGISSFGFCSQVEEIEFGENLQSIGILAFQGCSSLRTLSLPATVTEIGKNAFSYCLSLEDINVSPDNPAFASYNGIIYDKSLDNLICCPMGKRSVELSPTLKTVEESAFFGCKRIENIEFPESLKKIGELAFSGCTALTSINLPNNIKTINDAAFRGCESLQEVSLGSRLKYIGDKTFQGCHDITSICIYAVKPPMTGVDIFESDIYTDAVLHIPESFSEEYYTTEPWCDFLTISEDLPVDSGIEDINGDLSLIMIDRVADGFDIKGLPAGETVTVATIDGKMIYRGTNHQIRGLSKGIYILATTCHTQKLIIR